MGLGLSLYSRLAQTATGVPPMFEILQYARTWRRSSNAIGGYKAGSLSIFAEDVSRGALVAFYNANLGCRIVERTPRVTWEGYILAMQLKLDGNTIEQSLDPRYFANKVQVRYMSYDNVSAKIAWSENTDSSDIFGESCVILPLPGSTSAGATAYQATKLLELAWPRSRQVRGDVFSEGKEEDTKDELRVILAGYFSTLNLRYQETTLAAGNASTHISTLVGNSEFVTAGRVESNTLSVRVDAFPQAKRLGDATKEVIAQGGSGGEVWQGGVYADRLFRYEAAPTTWGYQMQGDVLLDQAANPVCLEWIEPGFLLYNPGAPTGWPRPGTSSGWDNPRLAYVEEVEFVSGEGGKPDSLRMRYRNAAGGERSEIIARQLRAAQGARG